MTTKKRSSFGMLAAQWSKEQNPFECRAALAEHLKQKRGPELLRVDPKTIADLQDWITCPFCADACDRCGGSGVVFLTLEIARQIVKREASMVWSDCAYDLLAASGESELDRDTVVEVVLDRYESHTDRDGRKAIAWLRNKNHELPEAAVREVFKCDVYTV